MSETSKKKAECFSDGLKAEILSAERAHDPRLIANGMRIPTLSYADQPYLVCADDGALVCIVTTGAGHEGTAGQHVTCLRSVDGGKSWSDAIALEPAGGVESSYAVLLKTPAGRIYAFYNHNTDNIRQVPGDSPPYEGGWCKRVDSLGYFVFKFSDDCGKTWSDRRYVVPVREFEIDRSNTSAGRIRYFWNVGKPFTHNGKGYVPLHKVGGFGHGFFTRTEGALLCSDNILSETDPEKIRFETLPDGDIGLRAPQGSPIAEEHSFVALSDGSFFAVYRTTDGHPACCYSRDGGHSWTAPDYLRYADGRAVKNPRAANFIWKLSGGNYLYWFHNHGGKDYEERNPVWCLCAREVDTADGKILEFSEPEVLLYDDDPFIRISYPDLIEVGGDVYVTQTQKNIARMHKLPADFVDRLQGRRIPELLDQSRIFAAQGPCVVRAPQLPKFCQRDMRRADRGAVDLRQGFTLSLTLHSKPAGGAILLDNRTADGAGWQLRAGTCGAIELLLSDGITQSLHVSESGLLDGAGAHRVAVIVDGGPKIVSYVVNGKFCDGGLSRQYGWSRFSPLLRHTNGSADIAIDAQVRSLEIFDRALMTAEALWLQCGTSLQAASG